MNLVDSSGWLEYFANDSNADFFSKPIEDTENLIVSTINLYEVFKKILLQKDESFALHAVALMQQGRVVDVDPSIALQAAKYSADLNLPMADSIILTTAYTFDAVLWTQDSDFENIAGVKYIIK